jgi:Ni/Co efflux regulator RcnB
MFLKQIFEMEFQMKKLMALLIVAGSLAGVSAQAFTEDENMTLNKECKALAQHILKDRSEEHLVKAQIKIADSKDERKSLADKLEKIQLDIEASKVQFQIACTPEK